MLNGVWGAESKGNLPHLSIPSKTAAWVSEFAVEDLPLSRTAALVPEFAVKDLPLGRILMMMMKIPFDVYYNILRSIYLFLIQSVIQYGMMGRGCSITNSSLFSLNELNGIIIKTCLNKPDYGTNVYLRN